MVMVQIRNMPEDLHRQLKARAALEGLSISDLALNELRRSLERPSRQELIARVSARSSAKVRKGAAANIRAERDAK